MTQVPIIPSWLTVGAALVGIEEDAQLLLLHLAGGHLQHGMERVGGRTSAGISRRCEEDGRASRQQHQCYARNVPVAFEETKER